MPVCCFAAGRRIEECELKNSGKAVIQQAPSGLMRSRLHGLTSLVFTGLDSAPKAAVEAFADADQG